MLSCLWLQVVWCQFVTISIEGLKVKKKQNYYKLYITYKFSPHSMCISDFASTATTQHSHLDKCAAYKINTQPSTETTYLSYYSACVITSMLPFSLLPQGPLGVAVTYGGDHIPKSPFNVAVAPTLDLNKISVTGLEDSKHFLLVPSYLISALRFHVVFCLFFLLNMLYIPFLSFVLIVPFIISPYSLP